jgi:hypothetical protein
MPVSAIIEHIDQLREELVLPTDYVNLWKPAESEMKKIDSNFVLFDYTNKLIYIFSLYGQLINKLTFRDFIIVNPKIYIDDNSGDLVFQEKSKNGVLILLKFGSE